MKLIANESETEALKRDPFIRDMPCYPESDSVGYYRNMGRYDILDIDNILKVGGQQVIQPEQLKELDTAEIVVPYGADGAGEPEQKYQAFGNRESE